MSESSRTRKTGPCPIIDELQENGHGGRNRRRRLLGRLADRPAAPARVENWSLPTTTSPLAQHVARPPSIDSRPRHCTSPPSPRCCSNRRWSATRLQLPADARRAPPVQRYRSDRRVRLPAAAWKLSCLTKAIRWRTCCKTCGSEHPAAQFRDQVKNTDLDASCSSSSWKSLKPVCTAIRTEDE
ncbi:hypothetical protein ACLK1Y_16295 [Escherichia coli]